jgi:hypothetical protein
LTLKLKMTQWKFARLSILVYGVVGPLIPILFVVRPDFFDSLGSLGLIGFLVLPTAYLLGGAIALAFGAAFAILAFMAWPLMPTAWIKTRTRCVMLGLAAGIALAAPLLAFVGLHPWVWLVCIPSAVCGSIVGALGLSALSANRSFHRSAVSAR